MASGKKVKAVIAAILLGVAAALFVFSCVTFLFYTTDTDGMGVSLWKLCLKKNGEYGKCLNIAFDCEEQHDKFSSARAFNIITIIIIITGFIFACLEAFRYKTLKWRVVFSLMAFVSGLVSWALCLSFFTTKHCELFGTAFSEKSNARLGGSFPAQFVAWFLVIFSIAIELVDPKFWKRCSRKKHNSNAASSSGGRGGEDHSPTAEHRTDRKRTNQRQQQQKTGVAAATGAAEAGTENNNNNHNISITEASPVARRTNNSRNSNNNENSPQKRR